MGYMVSWREDEGRREVSEREERTVILKKPPGKVT